MRCELDYRLEDEWDGSWYAETDINYVGGGQLDGWTLALRFPDGREITKSWSGNAAQNGFSVDFEGVGDTPGSAPTEAFLNGYPCEIN